MRSSGVRRPPWSTGLTGDRDHRWLVAQPVLRADGTVWAWGNNGSGQLGDNTTTSRSTIAPVTASRP